MERLSEYERQLVWRCLVAYSSDPIRSEELAGDRGPIASALNDGFDAVDTSTDGRQRTAASPTILDTSSLGLRSAGQSLLHYLSTLEREDRRLLISRHIAQLEFPSAEDNRFTDSRLQALEEHLEHEFDGAVDRVFDSVRELESPPSLASDDGKNRTVRVLPSLVALGAVAGAAILMRFVLTPTPSAQERIEAPSDTASELTDSVDLVQLVSDPSRDIRLFIDDEQFVVRSDPGTGRVIWRSGPHDAAVIHRIDANTVTLDRATKRVYLSLQDGTVLPP